MMDNHLNRFLSLCFFLFITVAAIAQGMLWAPDGNSYYDAEGGAIVQFKLPSLEKTEFVSEKQLTPAGASASLEVEDMALSEDGGQLLVYTNSQRVWRYNTRGDYWVLNLKSNALRQLGKGLPAASLMFAKISPDGSQAAYVSEHNVYVENLANGSIKKLTDSKGLPKLINGTFDWVYEEEFFCRDGFRWSPDSKSIAYWQVDANKIRDFYMVNNTDSVYSRIIPVEYPKAGDPPSPARIGVVNVASGFTTWMQPPGDPQEHYIPRMEWTPDGREVILQQLNRKQNESRLFLCSPANGEARLIYQEQDDAWVATKGEWDDNMPGWDWVNGGKDFIWVSEKDGWRHIYLISRDGKKETLLTKGDHDMMSLSCIDEKHGLIYYQSSPPDKATQFYLYSVSLNGKGEPKMVSPAELPGTHLYYISPNGQYARYRFSNYFTRPVVSWVNLPNHVPLAGQKDVKQAYDASGKDKSRLEYFTVTTEEGITMDAWMAKPSDFDPTKKYPVVFQVYGEPAAATVKDSWQPYRDFLYAGDMAADGYINISIDNRGTPAPKGRAWRKAIYRNIGQANIRDQAMAAREILKAPYMDTSRVAVWGWSGGGSSTLNLMFQYPEIYKVGVAIAPVTSSLLYDNIYTERYMGLPQENMEDYEAGAALTYAKNLQGRLLLVHGTNDDNVHFQNSEMLVNELVKYNKQFQYMAYPGRSHGMREGEGTMMHLSTMATEFLRTHCPPGAR
ncbi:MAG: S9 family peptidase [Phaeodactylibacter sp.]|nr:S9 family peptidase [Phaeodactylibacter sp.]